MARGGKSSDTRSGSHGAPIGTSFLDWFFRPAMLARATILAAVCALWPYAAQRLPSLAGRPEYRLTFRQIQVTPLPVRPVPENLVEQVEELADLPSDISLLDGRLTFEVAEAFRRHPWVSNVVRVQKSCPASVIVELQYRRPVAMVEVASGRVPIDVNGVVLPSRGFFRQRGDSVSTHQKCHVSIGGSSGTDVERPRAARGCPAGSALGRAMEVTETGSNPDSTKRDIGHGFE